MPIITGAMEVNFGKICDIKKYCTFAPGFVQNSVLINEEILCFSARLRD